MLDIHIIPVLRDNYIFVLHNKATKETAVIDPASARPVIDVLTERNLTLNTILNTHHHADHVGGNKALKKHYNCHIIGSLYDQMRIPGIDQTVSDNDTLSICSYPADVIFVPGHTSGHIMFYFKTLGILFCGDTLFAMGCGRLFEGTAEEMYHSLQKIKSLPPSTTIYCTHEYTLSNAQFALYVDPHNSALQNRYKKEQQTRLNHEFTIPFTLEDELQTNPFLRAKDADDFARLRKLKDSF